MSTEVQTPAPPGHLSEGAKALWSRILSKYELEDHELALLRHALESYDQANIARRALRQHGLTMLDRWDKPVPRPEVAIARDARAAFLRTMVALKLPTEEEEPAYGRPARGRGGRYAPRGDR